MPLINSIWNEQYLLMGASKRTFISEFLSIRSKISSHSRNDIIKRIRYIRTMFYFYFRQFSSISLGFCVYS